MSVFRAQTRRMRGATIRVVEPKYLCARRESFVLHPQLQEVAVQLEAGANK